MTNDNVPPTNTLHVNRWSDLPDCKETAAYRVQGGDDTALFSTSKKKRQVLEGLISQPIACSSKCCVSYSVLRLRRDYGVVIEMRMFKGSETSDGDRYGVYFLRTKLERVEADNDN